jgi:membrane protease YdiL (CAAX protease family)
MFDADTLWLVVILLIPLLKRFYFPIVNRLLGVVSESWGKPMRYTLYKYVAVVTALAGAYYLTRRPPLPVPSAAFTLGFLLGGIGLCAFDNALWRAIREPKSSRTHLLLVWPTLLGAVAEELLYRQAVAAVVGTEGLNAVLFVVVSAVFFSVNHLTFGTHEVAFKTFDGVVYCLAYLFAGPVVEPMLVHLGYNVAFVCWTTEIRDRVVTPSDG